VVLALQSIAGLRDSKLYGKDEAAEILDQISHYAIGRVGPDTAEWASNLIGEQEIREVTVNHTRTRARENSNSVSHNESFKTRKAVLPSQLMGITPCSARDGLTAYYVTRTEESVMRVTLGGNELFGRDLIPPSQETKDFLPRPTESQLLEPWTKSQRAEFAPAAPKTRKRKRNQMDRQPAKRQTESLLDALDEIS